MKALFFFLLLFVFSGASIVFAQAGGDTEMVADTLDYKSPKKATLYSMALPGLGQAYNRKYWKIPIIYAGIGTITYFIVFNTRLYRQYNEAYKYVSNEEEYPTDNELVDKYNLDQLRSGRDYYRRNMEVSYIFMGVWYILNILDAAVDAHLYNWNVGDDLSLKLEPQINPIYDGQTLMPQTGLKLTLSLP